jgi:signal transduction histidine kinase
MKIDKKTRLALQVFSGFTAILLIVGLAASLSLRSMNAVNQRIEYLVQDLNAKYVLMTRMRDATRERMVHVFALGYLEDPFEIENQWETISRHASEFLVAREQLYRLNLTEAQLSQLETQKAVLARGQQVVDAMMELIRGGEREAAAQKILDTLEVNNRILRELSDLRDFQEQLAKQSMQEASAAYHATRNQVFALTTLAALLSIFIAVVVIRRINSQETHLTVLLEQLETAKQELEQRVQERTAELRVARDQALEASYTKSRFLANMSHELRTPLNAILGYCEMIGEECQDCSRSHVLQDLDKIQASGRHLLELISDILEISKIEAGKVKIHPGYFSLAPLLDEVVEPLRPLLQQNRNTLALDFAPEIGQLYADKIRVRQVLYNLLHNANKFTQGGQITVKAEYHLQNGQPWVNLNVIDTGIGISEENQKKLFLPFTQVDPSTTRKYGGSGLGLVISLRFCQLMGGRITVYSRPGKGCAFSVWLPAHVQVEDSGEDDDDGEILCMKHEPS